MNIFKKLIKWYFTKKKLPYWGILMLDCIMVFFSTIWIHALAHGTITTIQNWQSVGIAGLLYCLCYMVGFRLFHTYSGVVRYSSFIDLMATMDFRR